MVRKTRNQEQKQRQKHENVGLKTDSKRIREPPPEQLKTQKVQS